MPYSPQNQSGLLGLVAALKGGMDPSTAYSLYQGIEQNQAARVAQRQERLSGLADLLMQSAGQGMGYEGASALAEAAPGPAGPAVQNMLGSLYPETDTGDVALDWIASGQEQSFPEFQQGMQSQRQSPVFTQSPMAQIEQQTAMAPLEQAQTEQLQAQQVEQARSEFLADASAYRRQGKTQEEFLQAASGAYPELFSGDIEWVQQATLTIFAQSQGA